MLTKDLARFKILKGQVKPGFIDVADDELLLLAEQLLEIFQQSIGLPRCEIDAEADRCVQSFPGDAVIGRGLVKLLNDRAQFTTPDDEALPDFRAKLFATGGALLSETLFATPEDYYRAMEEAMGHPLETLRETMFMDLPARHPLEHFKTMEASELLHHYNLALVKYLLLHTGELAITLPGAKPKNLRQILKYLRFNQLFAKVDKQDGVWSLTVDGPMNLFGPTRRYGIQLARFFPALLHQEAWTLQTMVQPRNKEALLVLDQRIGIKPPPGKFHAYVPDEITVFTKSIRDKLPGWSVDKEGSFVALPGDTHCFPDFTLHHQEGPSIALELFHPWHLSHLLPRLQQLDAQNEVPLLIGVARKCLKGEVAEATQQSPYFQKWGFAFNDMPTTKHLQSLLKDFYENKDL